MTRGSTIVLFGGTGFIGTHLAQHWLREKLAEKIVLVDLAPQALRVSMRQELSLLAQCFSAARWQLELQVSDPSLPHSALPVQPASLEDQRGSLEHSSALLQPPPVRSSFLMASDPEAPASSPFPSLHSWPNPGPA